MLFEEEKHKKVLERFAQMPWKDVAGAIVDRRNLQLKDPTFVSARDKFMELKELQRYFMAVVPRPCSCRVCVSLQQIQSSLVSETPPKPPSDPDSPMAKYVEECERKSAIHVLETDDYYLSALICLNYAHLLRPPAILEVFEPAGHGFPTEKPQLPCVCALVGLKRVKPEELTRKVQSIWDLIDWSEAWADDLGPTEKDDKGSCATYDIVQQLFEAKSGVQQDSESKPGAIQYQFDAHMIRLLASAPDVEHLHCCANLACRKIEWLRGEYQVCSRCSTEAKGVRHFYCSPQCQAEDWANQHKLFHSLMAKRA